jgi:hypothetical protein
MFGAWTRWGGRGFKNGSWLAWMGGASMHGSWASELCSVIEFPTISHNATMNAPSIIRNVYFTKLGMGGGGNFMAGHRVQWLEYL